MDTSSVRVEFRSDGVAVLTIDQPGAKVNVLTERLWLDLEVAIDSLRARTDVVGLVIASGKPGVFIAGADLKLLANATEPNDPAVRAFIVLGLRVLAKLEALPFPTCAAIDGAALGGGLEVALASDYRLVGNHPKVRLGLPEVKLGLIPGWGGTQRLSRIVGLQPAATMLLGGESYSASDAKLMHLAQDGGDNLLESACAFVVGNRGRVQSEVQKEFVSPSEPEFLAAREAVRVMVEGASLPLDEAIELETEAFMQLAGSPESKRLIGEFFASRKK